jgi:RNA polymerase sigma factor (sigma-70 family)
MDDVLAAQRGDRDALERVVRTIRDDVYHLALRMLGDPEDARDASQEVLVRIVTRLGSFRGESRFRTWVYRVATNALLDAREGLRRPVRQFSELGPQIDAAVASYTAQPRSVDAAVIAEAKHVCLQGMLMCLDPPHRIAYILGEILEIESDAAAPMLDITAPAFRKRLSRARADMEAFVAGRCGLADPTNACRCHKLAPAAVDHGLVDPARLRFTKLPVLREDRLAIELEKLRTAVELFTSLPIYAADDAIAAWIRETLATERN